MTAQFNLEQYVAENIPPVGERRRLKHNADVGAGPANFDASQDYAPGTAFQEARHEQQQRALPAARRADDGDKITAPDREVHRS